MPVEARYAITAEASQREEVSVRPYLRSLPTYSHRGSGSNEVECALCLEMLAEDDILRALPCFHSFHQACIDRWLLGPEQQFKQRACPICKADPLEGQPEYAAHRVSEIRADAAPS